MPKFSIQYIEAENNPIAIGSEKKTVPNNVELISEIETDVHNTEGALLNISNDYTQEKKYLEKSQKVLLNILNDYSEVKINTENTLSAVLNMLDDYSEEKKDTEKTLSAVINILEDFSEEKNNAENSLSALLNILDDYSEEKNNTVNTLSAALNILDDYAEEKVKIEVINENLASVNNELEQFIYSASHDLQEPIRMVSIYLQLIEKKYKDKLDKEGNEFINFAMDGSNRMLALIASLLDYSNVNIERPFETIDANELLKGVLKNLSNQINESNAIIAIESLPVIFGDKVLLSQLFQNLISNAIKFKSGKKPEIQISVKKNRADYLFSVKDNGIGIQTEYANKLFKIFQRLNARDKYPGTGIGLVVCKKIVEKHGGKIWFESEFGKGTTFYFTIKAKEEKQGNINTITDKQKISQVNTQTKELSKEAIN